MVNQMTFTRNRRRSDNKVPKYTHSTWNLEYRGVKASCSEDGKVTLTEEHDDETYDEVTVSANMIFRMAVMLNASKNVEFVDRKD
jgi:hypothetical protein